MLNKTPLFHPSLGLRVFLFLSLFLSFSLSQREKLLSSLSCPGLQDPHERVPRAFVELRKPRIKDFIGFPHKPKNISLFLSLFLIIDSGPPGSSPLKDLNSHAYAVLVPQSGIEPKSIVLEAQSLNHWTSREILI